MKKILFCFVLLFGWALSLSAQDIITTKDGTDIQVKILEITPYEVKYKKYDNLNGPIFSMLKSQILIVRYENGGNEIFGPKRYNDGGYLNTAETVSLGMKYREYKDFYDARMYVPCPGDPYSRGWAGVASAFIPGLGECVDGEWGRNL